VQLDVGVMLRTTLIGHGSTRTHTDLHSWGVGRALASTAWAASGPCGGGRNSSDLWTSVSVSDFGLRVLRPFAVYFLAATAKPRYPSVLSLARLTLTLNCTRSLSQGSSGLLPASLNPTSSSIRFCAPAKLIDRIPRTGKKHTFAELSRHRQRSRCSV